MPVDQIPYIGRFSADTPDWYAATGYGKWGMSSSMAAAGMITESILGDEEEKCSAYFRRSALRPRLRGKFLQGWYPCSEGFEQKDFYTGRSDLDELPPGHGGIVDYDGEKVGAYRDEEGEIYLVSAKCPHLGCQLEWNPDENVLNALSRFQVRLHGELCRQPGTEWHFTGK